MIVLSYNMIEENLENKYRSEVIVKKIINRELINEESKPILWKTSDRVLIDNND